MKNFECFKKIENDEILMTITGGGTCAYISAVDGSQQYFRHDVVGYNSILAYTSYDGGVVVCWGDGVAALFSVL